MGRALVNARVRAIWGAQRRHSTAAQRTLVVVALAQLVAGAKAPQPGVAGIIEAARNRQACSRAHDLDARQPVHLLGLGAGWTAGTGQRHRRSEQGACPATQCKERCVQTAALSRASPRLTCIRRHVCILLPQPAVRGATKGQQRACTGKRQGSLFTQRP